MVVKIKNILLSFDLEEFDLPNEIKEGPISEEAQFKTSKDGAERVLELLDKCKIKATFFISAKFAQKYPSLIKNISKDHEIGLHCYDHKNKDFSKLKEAKKIIEKIINKKIKGFRAPRFQSPNYKTLKELGIVYDSSSHPTYIPGRYNDFLKSRKITTKEGVKIIPVSVSPLLRLPLFWIVFRNMPLLYSKLITKSCFIKGDHVCLIFHPWEFINLKEYKIPFLIKRNTGKGLELKLEKYIKWCLKKNFIFMSIDDYLFKNL